LESHVGKSQRTNTKIVAARDGRERFNFIVFCRAGIAAAGGSGGGHMPMSAIDTTNKFV
jgi:hypothetical protein